MSFLLLLVSTKICNFECRLKLELDSLVYMMISNFPECKDTDTDILHMFSLASVWLMYSKVIRLFGMNTCGLKFL